MGNFVNEGTEIKASTNAGTGMCRQKETRISLRPRLIRVGGAMELGSPGQPHRLQIRPLAQKAGFGGTII
jgi:hypothetical protein